MWRLRFAVAVAFVTLVFLAGRAFAETNADAPTGKPDAVIDLATKEGVDLVKGQWRYSDTKIIPVDFKAAGPDKQPTGKPIKTYDFTPHAGAADFDDSKWEILDATTLDARRSTGRLCFNWYRINITIPPTHKRRRRLRVQRRFSRRRSMITPKSGLMANCARAGSEWWFGSERLECGEQADH